MNNENFCKKFHLLMIGTKYNNMFWIDLIMPTFLLHKIPVLYILCP